MQHTLTIARSASGGVRTIACLRLLLTLFLALVLMPAFAAGPAPGGAALRSPQLARLQVEIWPEYDRPAALVILRGALAADTSLPAKLTLRIPAASGGPSALAYSAEERGNLLNLEYERTGADDFIALRFIVPQRYFHVEYYEPIATAKPERSYTYVWPGDLQVKQLNVIAQEPAAASNFSVLPNLDASATGPDGLRYRSAELGAQAAGKQLPIKVSYTKTDARTSSEILQPKAPAPATGSGDEVSKGVLVFILALSLLIGIGAAILWWRGRARPPEARPTGAGVCAKCGTPRIAGARYCANCGARLK